MDKMKQLLRTTVCYYAVEPTKHITNSFYYQRADILDLRLFPRHVPALSFLAAL